VTTLRLWGIITALAALLADQASKQWLLFNFDIGARQPVRLAPFLDIVLAWNRGVSYSLFSTDSAQGRAVLLTVTLVATAALAIWMWRTRSRITILALGLLIGGALGNAYDRYAYGAVADFVWFHIGSFSWYIFNGADVAIVFGVCVLIYESFLGKPRIGASKLP
jgi:signal peptidase II